MTLDERTTRALAGTVALLTPAQYAELHLRVTLELRAATAAERERCAQVADVVMSDLAAPDNPFTEGMHDGAFCIGQRIRALD